MLRPKAPRGAAAASRGAESSQRLSWRARAETVGTHWRGIRGRPEALGTCESRGGGPLASLAAASPLPGSCPIPASAGGSADVPLIRGPPRQRVDVVPQPEQRAPACGTGLARYSSVQTAPRAPGSRVGAADRAATRSALDAGRESASEGARAAVSASERGPGRSAAEAETVSAVRLASTPGTLQSEKTDPNHRAASLHPKPLSAGSGCLDIAPSRLAGQRSTQVRVREGGLRPGPNRQEAVTPQRACAGD